METCPNAPIFTLNTNKMMSVRAANVMICTIAWPDAARKAFAQLVAQVNAKLAELQRTYVKGTIAIIMINVGPDAAMQEPVEEVPVARNALTTSCGRRKPTSVMVENV